MKVSVMAILIGALGTVAKELVQGLEDLEIRGRMKSSQTTALLKSAWILEAWGDSDSSEKPTANHGEKKENSQRVKYWK